MNIPSKGCCPAGPSHWVPGERCQPLRTFCPDPCTCGTWVVDAAAQLQGLGRIIRVDVPLKKICPGRRVALAVLLAEIDDCGCEHPCGTQILTVPALPGDRCRDVLVRGIHFVLPEENCTCCDCCQPPHCRPRTLALRTYANYLGGDFTCCQGEIVSKL